MVAIGSLELRVCPLPGAQVRVVGNARSVRCASRIERGEIYGAIRIHRIGRNIKMLMPEPYRWERDGHSGNLPTTSEAKLIGPGRVVTGQRKDGTTFPV